MRFDYYAATIPEPVNLCVSTLSEELGGSFLTSKPLGNYTEGLECTVGGFRLYHGGLNPHPFFVSTGEDAAIGAEALRRSFPSHRVARADVAFDFLAKNGFDQVVKLIEPIARHARVKVMFYGDPDPSQKAGRTMYFGSKDSDIRLRVYEKGLEQRGKGVADELAPEEWIRVELQTRPRKGRKTTVASMVEAELFGLSKWSLKVAQDVLLRNSGLLIPYTPDRSMRESSVDRAIRFMCEQYGNAMRAFVDKHGRKALDRQITDTLLQGSALDPSRLH